MLLYICKIKEKKKFERVGGPMVAKSYQKLEIVKEPYEVNGKLYVKVKLGNGNLVIGMGG